MMTRSQRYWIILPLAGSLLIGITLGILLSVTQDLPQVENLQTYEPSSMTTILSDDGRPVRSLFVERRIPVALSEVPDTLVKAVIAVEDSRFYRHFGLDLRGILRALLKNILTLRFAQGGSTLTQQLSKVLFLTPEKTLIRKIREAVLAINIERRFSKDEILTLYLNQVYLGEGAYGVEAASRTYFGKSVGDLSLAECAMIAGLPRSPILYSPISNPERAQGRMKIVLQRLLTEGYITQQEHDGALEAGLSVSPAPPSPDPAPYFTEIIRRKLEERIGANMLYRGGIIVESTLDLELQEAAAEAVRRGMEAYNRRHPDRGEGEPVQAALFAMDPLNGEVKALVGGRDFSISPYNRATQARRQPGSAFKPFLYAAAVARGIPPTALLNDAPLEVPLRGQPPYVPVNYSGRYHGPVTVRSALEHSYNAASVDLLLKVGYQPVIEMAGKLGIRGDLKPYPTLALGVFDVSLEEMVAAYGAFANRGILVAPRYVRRVLDRQGQVLWEDPLQLTDAVSPQVAYVTTSLLEGVILRGTGKLAAGLGPHVAGKTGTTDDYRDAWFVGFTPQLAAGVWVGRDVPSSLGHGEAGARAALPIWKRFMEKAMARRPSREFTVPAGLELAEIDPSTGLLAGPDCPSRIVEVFLPGTVPDVICDPHLEFGGQEDLPPEE
ncbi:MAG: PBP1A family penicillin-binding protein [bacterium]|nr:MAG: PBP1A family penicillin-binding protein [bacterium]